MLHNTLMDKLLQWLSSSSGEPKNKNKIKKASAYLLRERKAQILSFVFHCHFIFHLLCLGGDVYSYLFTVSLNVTARIKCLTVNHSCNEFNQTGDLRDRLRH